MVVMQTTQYSWLWLWVRADGDVCAENGTQPLPLFSAFHPEPVRFFEPGQADRAMAWLGECETGSSLAGDRATKA